MWWGGQRVRVCYECWYFVCKKCLQAHENEQIQERSNPAGKHTCLTCDAGCELSVFLPPVNTPDEPLEAAMDKVDTALPFACLFPRFALTPHSSFQSMADG
jgi:hypothetical protein